MIKIRVKNIHAKIIVHLLENEVIKYYIHFMIK